MGRRGLLLVGLALAVGSVFAHDRVARYVAEFNAADEELYANTIPNVSAAEFLSKNIPILECPDVDIERTYYFRWWTFRKHLKKTQHGWVVTEFLPDVAWAGAENTIVCPFGHQVREGRWLRDGRILRDYMRFMVERGTIDGPKSYVNWPALAYLEREKVWGERNEAVALLPRLVSRYASWEKGWLFRGRYPMRFVPAEELFHSADNREGMEYSASGHGARLIVNSAMAAEAAAIATLARAGGKSGLADEYAAKAAVLTTSLKTKLWNEALTFFVTRHDDGVLADVREIQGYAPWYFLPTVGSKYAVAWQFLTSPSHFLGKYGLTSVDRSSPRFTISYTGHPCQWNGPSWPYTTSLTLTALGNAIRNGESGNLGASDYIRLLRQYAAAHRITKENGEKCDWIDENLNPDTGDWISRTMLHDRPTKLHENPRERGKDYNHSTFCDLVISDLAGFRPRLDGTFDVKPFIPPDWSYFRLDNIPWRGHLVSIVWDRDGTRYGKGSGLRVLLDGMPHDVVKN